MTVKVTIESDEPIEVNGVSVPPSGGGSVPEPEPVPPPQPDSITWEQFTGQPFGTEDNSSYHNLPHMAAGIVNFKLVLGGEKAFDSDVMYGMSAGFRVTRVGAEREEWASRPGNEDIVAKIDAMNLGDDDFACFPHGDNVRELPFYAVPFTDGAHGTFYVTDKNGITQPIKYQFREPATLWVVTNGNPQGSLSLRNTFDT